MYQKFRKEEAAAERSGAMESGTHLKNGASPKIFMIKGKVTQKIFLFFAAFCISVASTVAQDIIILKNGDEIPAVVLEIGIDDVKYKRFDNRNGPNYTLRQSEIFMIRYASGNKDVFNKADTKRYAGSQQLSDLKYTFGKQINTYGPEKSPFLAGFLSLLIPGVGQFYNGDVGAGFLFMGCNVGCNLVWLNAYDETTFTIGLIGALVVNVSSIVNGVRISKRVNTARGYYRGYYLGENTYLNIQPAIIQQNHLVTGEKYAYGMSICLDF